MFLHSEGILQDDFEDFFGQFGKRGPKRLLSYYSPEEIGTVTNQIRWIRVVQISFSCLMMKW